MLIVALSKTPGEPDLDFVDVERGLLERAFPAAGHTLIEGPDATRAAVKDALRGHNLAHFSCHGGQRLEDPSQGGVMLQDGMLTVADLADERHRGEFVYLSACQTALGGVFVPDEAITLATALQYAGWRHVIATLWIVWDRAAADISSDVYNDIVRANRLEPQLAAEALHHAARSERQRQHNAGQHHPRAWAPFVHAGP
jgi:CHAT domain-containing protein